MFVLLFVLFKKVQTMDINSIGVTTAIILETRKKLKDNKHPVTLRVTFQRKSKYYTVKKESYTTKEFEHIYKPNVRGKNKERRHKFDAIEKRAIEIIEGLSYFSFEAFEQKYLNKKAKDTTIESYFDSKASELESNNKIQTATLYRATIKSIQQFDEKVSFQKITPGYLKKYEKWMLDEGKTYTTIGMYMRNLRHIVNLAITDSVINEYPFSTNRSVDKTKYSIPNSTNTKKALTIAEVKKLFNYETHNRNEYYYLQYFLFSYLCNGMNMADIANLKFKDIKGDELTFIRQKTKDTSINIPVIKVHLLPYTQKIIEGIGNKIQEPNNYVFPIYKSDSTEIEKFNLLKQHIKLTNKYVRKVAKNVGIDEGITTYWARHTFSTILKNSGSSIEYIAEQLGHQSTKVTKNYLDSFENSHRKEQAQKLIPK